MWLRPLYSKSAGEVMRNLKGHIFPDVTIYTPQEELQEDVELVEGRHIDVN